MSCNHRLVHWAQKWWIYAFNQIMSMSNKKLHSVSRHACFLSFYDDFNLFIVKRNIVFYSSKSILDQTTAQKKNDQTCTDLYRTTDFQTSRCILIYSFHPTSISSGVNLFLFESNNINVQLKVIASLNTLSSIVIWFSMHFVRCSNQKYFRHCANPERYSIHSICKQNTHWFSNYTLSNRKANFRLYFFSISHNGLVSRISECNELDRF